MKIRTYILNEHALIQSKEVNMISRRIIAFSAAAALSSALFCTSAYASAGYSAADMLQLRDVLLGVSETSAANDVNSDGLVDAFDMCAIRRNFTDTGELITASYPATDEYVKLTGRTLYSGDTTWLVQSGSAVEFTVTGKSAEVTLAGDSSINNDENYRSRYAVLVD